jgi:hypothetical protein
MLVVQIQRGKGFIQDPGLAFGGERAGDQRNCRSPPLSSGTGAQQDPDADMVERHVDRLQICRASPPKRRTWRIAPWPRHPARQTIKPVGWIEGRTLSR